ncbi:hypothetical protein H3Z83_06825 [Tenacibaculum sp. S7007]|uniref:Uncharacterized protein n=1 Tax=Tenacibaculum pelagium TaxID=2759527 RepID=A0A839AMA3_9FLAO|nr:hypothetical protein [Tenacibaculum pelagium]MBA6156232.1 hypothetical protein [Tenacibaculum pelagium]
MKLTTLQIEQLYKFTRQHYMEHYDVQTELVDHLANDIEQIWIEKPALTFKQARDISFKKFGIFGFMDVLEEKQKQMNKKYFRIILGFVKQWFSIPKIIVTLTMFYCFYLLLQFSFAQYLFPGLFFTILIIEFILLLKRRKKLNTKFKTTGKKWLFEDIIETQGNGNVIFGLFYVFQFLTPNSYDNLSTSSSLIISAATTLAVIIGYVSLIVIPKKAEYLLEKHYPEYKLV